MRSATSLLTDDNRRHGAIVGERPGPPAPAFRSANIVRDDAAPGGDAAADGGAADDAAAWRVCPAWRPAVPDEVLVEIVDEIFLPLGRRGVTD